MRPPFSAWERIQARAKNRRNSLEVILEQWFSHKYKLPPSHPLFKGRPIAEHLEEFMRDKMDERDQLREMLQNPDTGPQERSKLMEQIESIDKFLGDVDATGSGDALADLWEAQLEAGEDPDFDLTMEDLERGRY